jgi:hypothetical protein
MSARRHADAVHSVYAGDEPAGDEPAEEVEPQLAEPPLVLPSRRRRLATMALLGAVVGVVAVLLVRGLRTPEVGGGVGMGAGRAGPVLAAQRPNGARVGHGASGLQDAPEVGPKPRPAAVMRMVGERAVGGKVVDGRAADQVRKVLAVPRTAGVRGVPTAQAAGSEFGFER